MSRLQRGVAAVALMAPVLVAALPAHAAVITADEILGQFNAVVTDNFSTNSDVEGRLVAGNINNSGSSTFYEGPNPLSSPSAFRGVNALTIQSCPGCNVNNGGGVNFITSNSGTFNLNGGGSVAQNNPSFAMSDFTAPLNGLQTELGALAQNSTVMQPKFEQPRVRRHARRRRRGVRYFRDCPRRGRATTITSRSRTRHRRRRSSSMSPAASRRAAARISTAIPTSMST